ncbi:MAG TPA: DNA polymerase III subunit beta, partial [Phycisphaerae bacterium]|nr:DNA polymerase III subunit beta [Phycisphaerae bacterium]
MQPGASGLINAVVKSGNFSKLAKLIKKVRDMKVTVQTGALQDALALAGSIVQNRSPKPVLKCVKLVAADNVLTILATDLEVGCRYQITAVQIDEPGEALVPADRLIGIAREASGDSLTLETDKQTVLVTGTGSKFKIFGYDPGEFPAVADFAETADFELPISALSNMIGKTIFATAKAHSHYAISGVLWEAQDSRLMLVATDGYRLAQANGTLSKKSPEAVRAIVPGKLTSLIHRITGDGSESVQVKIDANQILIRTPRAVLVGSLVQGNFPKYEDVIPKSCPNKATIATSELEHRLRQASLMMTDESRGVRFN